VTRRRRHQLAARARVVEAFHRVHHEALDRALQRQAQPRRIRVERLGAHRLAVVANRARQDHHQRAGPLAPLAVAGHQQV
jgi:hypothetical protein